jgi:low temperature requirement protein LtrA
VLVHAALYYRVNTNIIRVAPFNIASALLVVVAGLLHGPHGTASVAAYLLWILALAVQLGSPLIVHPSGLFELRPAHFSERHNALLIVAIGESVAAVGIGAAVPQGRPVSWQLLATAVLGLAVAAALWWIVFGGGGEDRAEQVLTAASSLRRTALALSAYFYGFIPLLLGLVAMAAGVLTAVLHAAGPPATAPLPHRIGLAALLACGATAFLAGNVIIRRQLGMEPLRPRAAAALAALATAPVGVFAGLNAQLVVVAAVLVAPLVAEHRLAAAGGLGGPDLPVSGQATGGTAEGNAAG